MNMSEKYSFKNCVGECPRCGWKNLAYSREDINDGVEYHFTCCNCGAVGKEIYAMTYVNSVIEVEGE